MFRLRSLELPDTASLLHHILPDSIPSSPDVDGDEPHAPCDPTVMAMGPWATGLKHRKSLSAFFNNLFTDSPKATEGLYWLSIWSADGSFDSEEFHHVLQQLVIPRMLKDEGTALVWKLRNTSPAARGGNTSNNQRPQNGGPCALIARLEDVEMLWTSKALQKLAAGRRDGNQPRVFGTEARTYELVQRYEGRRGPKAKGSCIVAVLIEPAPGHEAEVEAWYRREHLALMAATPTHVRSTRYKLRMGLVEGSNDDAPSLLTLHECMSTKALLDHAIQYGQIVPETPWSKRIFAANSVERTVWDITGKYQQPDVKLDKL